MGLVTIIKHFFYMIRGRKTKQWSLLEIESNYKQSI